MFRLSFIFFAAALSACATSPNAGGGVPAQPVPGASLARNVALATGLTSLSGPLVDVAGDQSLNGVRSQHGHIDANLAGAAAAPVLSGGGLDPLLLAAAFIDGGRLAHPATRNHVLAWMPKSQAATAAEAREQMAQTLEAAFVRAIVETHGWQTYELTFNEGGLLTGEKMVTRTYLRGGPVCGTKYLCRVNTRVEAPEQMDSAPAFTGVQGPVWTWRNWQEGDKSRDTNVAEVFMSVLSTDKRLLVRNGDPTGLNARAAYQQATASLPGWVFYYQSPSASANYPAMFHRGQERLFVAGS